MRRVRDFLRPLDFKLILSLTALIVTVTVCYGFVQRGDHITSAEASVQTLTGQVDRLLDENASLHDQLTRIERRSARRERAAAADREALSRELLRLTEWLRANGIRVPAATYRLPVSSSTPASAHSGGGGHAQAQSDGPSSPAPQQPSSSPGNSNGHGQGHGPGGVGHGGGHGGGKGHKNGASVHVGPDGASIDLPGDLPDIRLP